MNLGIVPHDFEHEYRKKEMGKNGEDWLWQRIHLFVEWYKLEFVSASRKSMKNMAASQNRHKAVLDTNVNNSLETQNCEHKRFRTLVPVI